MLLFSTGSCADILHSTKKFGSGFRENVIAIILRDVVKALNYLHSLGYVHRSVCVRVCVCVSVCCMGGTRVVAIGKYVGDSFTW